MEEVEIKQEDEKEMLYTKQDFDSYKKELEEKFQAKEEEMKKQLELDAKKNSMTEMERIQLELDEMKQKYQEKENECQIAKEREETIELLENSDLEKELLEVVFVPLDMEKTKTKIESLKWYVEKMKKDFYETAMADDIPLTSKQLPYDAFIDGFDSNLL